MKAPGVFCSPATILIRRLPAAVTQQEANGKLSRHNGDPPDIWSGETAADFMVNSWFSPTQADLIHADYIFLMIKEKRLSEGFWPTQIDLICVGERIMVDALVGGELGLFHASTPLWNFWKLNIKGFTDGLGLSFTILTLKI